MSSKNLRLGFDVEMNKTSKAMPLYFKPWTTAKSFRVTPTSPLPYMSDALTSLSFYKVIHWLYPEFTAETAPKDTCVRFWNELEPGPSLFENCRERIDSLRKTLPQAHVDTVKKFEGVFVGAFKAAFTPEGVDLKVLSDALNAIQYFEEEMRKPLVYNFQFSFSPEIRNLLQAVESFLFNLRSLIAADLNAHVRDTSHEGFKVDPVSDYLPKADYVVSDALLYFQFKKLTTPFVMGQKTDVRIEKLLVEPLNKAFFQYTQNACYLVNALPPEFLEQLGPGEAEEALYHIQMDWLLGTDSGLLFKIREELYGLENGYDRVFWPELRDKSYLKPAHLHISVELSESDVFGKKAS
ncbi:MAG: hypothetical protein V4736_10145 [Bdellovibrionota bacterium]